MSSLCGLIHESMGLKVWMETEEVKYSSSSLIRKAITYAYKRWDNMMSYLNDGRIHIDNNLAENAIRPITLGHKNYLFCGNDEAAENMSVVCSLLATCKAHDVNPRFYHRQNAIYGESDIRRTAATTPIQMGTC